MQQNKPNLFDGQTICADEFLNQYWQKKPYLFKQTRLDLGCLPDQKALFELAHQPDVQSRIVYSDDQLHFNVRHDEPDSWQTLSGKNPTLLVSDIEKWLPESAAVLESFPFIKSWRLDDLMMSFAKIGASVGAHIDHYDVFLIQVQGQRQWHYNEETLSSFKQVEDCDLCVIQDFKAQIIQTLNPGDVLYLPPEVPHHGIALTDDCITCSIGMRAPSASEIIGAVADHVNTLLPQSQRYKDQSVNSDVSTKISNRITAEDIIYIRTLINKTQYLTDLQIAEVFGHLITSYRLLDEPADLVKNNHSTSYQRSAFSRFSFFPKDENQARLFINGESFSCGLALAKLLCDEKSFDTDPLKLQFALNDAEKKLVQQLIENGDLIPVKR